MQKNGVTLELESVDWQVMGTTPVDGTLVPNLYKAVAIYSGRATGSKPSGYTATLLYSGEVIKSIPGRQQVSVVYRGEPVQTTQPDSSLDPAPLIGMCALSFVFAASGAVLVVFLAGRYRKKAQQQAEYPEDDDTPMDEQELLDVGYDPLSDEEELDNDEIY